MKFSFRVTILGILLTLITITVVALGVNSYRNVRFAGHDLSSQILEQTSERIDQQAHAVLSVATLQGRMNQLLLQSGQFPINDFSRLAPYWLEVMHAYPRFTRLSLGIEATGEWYYVRHTPNDKLALGTLRRNPQTNKLELSTYWPEDFPRKPFYFNQDKTDEDPRLRPWYRAAKAAGKQTWSPTYVFFGAEGFPDVPGVSCSTPVFGPDGRLLGALTSSFGLYEICDYLATLRIGQGGFAIIVEERADGSRQVIGHPQRDVILRSVSQPGKPPVSELVPTDELSDLRVRDFLEYLPPAGQGPSAGDPSQRVHFIHDGVHYLGSYSRLSDPDAPNWLICVILPEADVLGRVQEHSRETFLIGLGVFALAVVASLLVSRRISTKLEYLARETTAIGQWHLQPRPVAHSMVREVDRLAVATEETKTGLRSFQKYVPADLVRRLLASGQEAELGGECRTVSIFFSDIANFTSIAEKLSPMELVNHLGEYLGACSHEILETRGTVDKYIGDAIMAFWGAPEPNPQHALAACTAALRCQQTVNQLAGEWEKRGLPPFATRIGIHTGEAVVGNIGSAARLNYTLIGDAVNLASRLEGLNKYYGTAILISEATFQEAKGVLARPLDWVSVKGKTQAVLVYELLGLKGEVSRDDENLVELYGRALAHYRAQDWASALQLFEEVLRLRPGDPPAQQMVGRCQSYAVQGPGNDWDGVYRMDAK